MSFDAFNKILYTEKALTESTWDNGDDGSGGWAGGRRNQELHPSDSVSSGESDMRYAFMMSIKHQGITFRYPCYFKTEQEATASAKDARETGYHTSTIQYISITQDPEETWDGSAPVVQ